MVSQNKRLSIILTSVVGLLLLPLVAMKFTAEVNWNIFDFIVMGVLLLGTGLTCEFTLRKVKSTNRRLLLCAAILLVFFLVWAELAVGILGSPFAGS